MLSYLEWLHIPEHFYLLCKWNSSGFKSGLLKGIEGLSTNPFIVIKKFSNRPVLIKMPGSDTLALNNLSQVDYTNPDSLVANNLATLKRVNGTSLKNIISHVLFKLKTHKYEKVAATLAATLPNVKNINDIAQHISSSDQPKIKSIIEKFILDSLVRAIPEQEWLVEGKVLKLPQTSSFLVATRYLDEMQKSELAYFPVNVVSIFTQENVNAFDKLHVQPS